MDCASPRRAWWTSPSPAPNNGQKSPAWEDVAAAIPDDFERGGLAVYHLTLPSPRVRPSDALRDYALPSFPARRPIFDAVRDLTARIHADFTFDAKATTVHTPPEELLGVASRRVPGFCPPGDRLPAIAGPGGPVRERLRLRRRRRRGRPRLTGADASHAWVSVFCGPLGWVDFDPTNDAVVGDSHITIGWGRDYGDVCPIQGVFVGGGQHSMNVGVDVVPAADEA